MTTLYIWIAGIISGILGSMGLGGGGVLILYLTLIAGVAQLKAQGINLMFFIPCAALATAIYMFKKKVKLKALLPFIIAGIPGVLAGTYISGVIGTDWVARLFGGGLVILGLREIFAKSKNNNDSDTKEKPINNSGSAKKSRYEK